MGSASGSGANKRWHVGGATWCGSRSGGKIEFADSGRALRAPVRGQQLARALAAGLSWCMRPGEPRLKIRAHNRARHEWDGLERPCEAAARLSTRMQNHGHGHGSACRHTLPGPP